MCFYQELYYRNLIATNSFLPGLLTYKKACITSVGQSSGSMTIHLSVLIYPYAIKLLRADSAGLLTSTHNCKIESSKARQYLCLNREWYFGRPTAFDNFLPGLLTYKKPNLITPAETPPITSCRNRLRLWAGTDVRLPGYPSPRYRYAPRERS